MACYAFSRGEHQGRESSFRKKFFNTHDDDAATTAAGGGWVGEGEVGDETRNSRLVFCWSGVSLSLVART